MYRGKKYSVDFLPKIKVQVLVPDELAEKAVELIANAARTSKIGDGKIVVIPTEEVIRIRTGEREPNAI